MQAPREDRCTIAVCFFGLLARWSKSNGTNHLSAPLTQNISYPSFVENVIRANPSCATDVFVHSSETGFARFVQQLLNPVAAAFGTSDTPFNTSKGWMGGEAPQMFASI